ncbi:MAG: hypothetical protein WBX20_10545 [Terrimicrobiaceae bacterium]
MLTISAMASDGELQTRESIRIPAEFRQGCHGYVVTSRNAQGARVDSGHVLVAAERLTSK